MIYLTSVYVEQTCKELSGKKKIFSLLFLLENMYFFYVSFQSLYFFEGISSFDVVLCLVYPFANGHFFFLNSTNKFTSPNNLQWLQHQHHFTLCSRFILCLLFSDILFHLHFPAASAPKSFYSPSIHFSSSHIFFSSLHRQF